MVDFQLGVNGSNAVNTQMIIIMIQVIMTLAYAEQDPVTIQVRKMVEHHAKVFRYSPLD